MSCSQNNQFQESWKDKSLVLSIKVTPFQTMNSQQYFRVHLQAEDF